MDDGAARARRPRARLRVSVVNERGRPVEPRLGRWLARVAPARARGTVNVALVSDARVRALNGRYRGKDSATDVLSFAPDDAAGRISRRRPIPPVQPVLPIAPSMGEIVIARGVAKRQARAAGHSELTELRVLALHGLLHLLGYDHERDDGRMRRVEQRLRRRGGLRESLIERTSS
jgi:probable rRNA maturation factor